jgi:hypothetical protein
MEIYHHGRGIFVLGVVPLLEYNRLYYNYTIPMVGMWAGSILGY